MYNCRAWLLYSSDARIGAGEQEQLGATGTFSVSGLPKRRHATLVPLIDIGFSSYEELHACSLSFGVSRVATGSEGSQ